MNIDTEIFSKILANWIQQYSKNTIHHGQVRFISWMQGWFSIHKSVNVIYHINSLKPKSMWSCQWIQKKLLTKFSTPHWLNGHELEQTPRDGEGQGSLACCSPGGHKELDTTEQLNWTELNWTYSPSARMTWETDFGLLIHLTWICGASVMCRLLAGVGDKDEPSIAFAFRELSISILERR